VLSSAAHLLEIDLIRQGKRPPMKKRLPDYPYFVFLSRSERRPMTEIWPIAFDSPLPTIPVPLLPGDLDVTLDLQNALTVVYDANRFDLDLDYDLPPPVPRPDDGNQWLARIQQAPR